MTALPGATDNPCGDCPWRRAATRGWLGPYSAEQWLTIVHSDEPIACHQTITTSGTWDGALQCRGAAIFRENRFKLPRDPAVVVGPEDRVRVFSTDQEFVEHHHSPLADWLAEQREGPS
jgi:hypothetical protein